MLLNVLVAGMLLFQVGGSEPELAERIRHLLRAVLTSGDENQESAARAEANRIFRERGLPEIAAVGDDAAYEFVVLACSGGTPALQEAVLRRAREGAQKNVIPRDAATYCEAHLRQESAKATARRRPPTNPALRKEIEQLFQTDQSVRQKTGFDLEKMTETDRALRHRLEAIFRKYGVPTYRMVGPDAAASFATMIQHQEPEFRERVLPKLDAAVRVGQADASSYASMLDRARTDAGKPQVYGQNLVCDKEHPQLHPAPIEDARNVDQRRAAIGLFRLKLYIELVIAMSPDVCGAVSKAP